MPLIPTFRLPVQIHTRSANSKWLDEIAHTNPLWIHPIDAKRIGVGNGELIRVETRIGHFIVKAWVTEGIRPGVVACSHHMGRWKTAEHGQRQMMSTVKLDRDGTRWLLRRETGVQPYQSRDADTERIWWTDAGVHQNLTFAVQPELRLRKASSKYYDKKAARRDSRGNEKYGRWRTTTYYALDLVSPEYFEAVRVPLIRGRLFTYSRTSSDVVISQSVARALWPTGDPIGTRRPYWMMRPLKPSREVYRLTSTRGSLPTR